MKKFMKYLSITFFTILTFLLVMNIEYVDAAESYPFTGIVTADSLIVHSGDNYSSKVSELVYGTRVIVLGKGSNGSRYKIKYDGKEGYVSKNYILNVDTNVALSNRSNVETYQAYCKTLTDQGFHESYCPYLYFLHAKYPQWQFKADIIDKTLEEVSTNEQWKCSLQTGNTNYWLQTTPQESNYYYINKSVIASFMDPRNSLFESTIFQFLDMDATKDLASDAALSSIVGEGNLKQYLPIFKQAASKQGINAVQLVARSKQEGNNTVNYGPSSGKYTTLTGTTYNGKTLDGFYNFYNIGAYNANGLTPQARAVAYAAGYLGGTSDNRPWTTPELAIEGGASFIASKYIRKGQDTNYYQKFNVSSYRTNNMYTNQYMTNIYAPTSEGVSIKEIYSNSNLMSLPFVFTIPVYKNMNASPAQAINKKSDSYLKAITIDGKALTGFDKDVVEYSYNAVTNNNYVTVSATTNDTDAKVSGVGKVSFANGVATVSLIVTAEDGSKTTYKLKIKQVKTNITITVNDIVSKMNVKVSGTNMYGMSPGTAVSTLVNTVTKNGGSASVVTSAGKVKSSGNLATEDKITIKGTTESKVYTISIRGDVNGDGSVTLPDFVLVQSHILKKVTLSGEKFYAGDVNYNGTIKLDDFVLIQSHILKKASL